ncbi:hypothetical protein [Aliikangiella sp. G2MR2-5]|uniref:hypothetical protein n=1 Tax=Aliikangiella sp. G2MR2-5 TaxID=2788943 RepID=UPI0018AAB464|nr:hypothetical protein [Aliikangiella sp. G2MR2-5]
MHKSIIAAVAAMGVATSVAASNVTIADNILHMKSSSSGGKVEMTVSGPNGLVYNSTFVGGDNAISAADMKATKDGLYKFELLEIEELGEEKVRDDMNGRGLTTRKIVKSNKVSGQFRVQNGVLIDSKLTEDENSKTSLNK